MFDPGLEQIRHAEVDPGHRALVGLDGSRRRDTRRRHRPAARLPVAVALGQVVDGHIDRRRCHHELRVTSSQPQLNRARSELAGDLLRRRRQHVLQGETDRCVQRCDKALSKGTSFVTASLGGNRKLAVNVVDVRS